MSSLVEQKPDKMTYLVSATSFVDRSSLIGMAKFLKLSFNNIAAVASAAQLDGAEWVPLNPLINEWESNRLTSPTKAALKAAIQSPRGEKSWAEVLAHKNPVLAAMVYLSMPERVESLDTLIRLQSNLYKRLPVTVYPPHSVTERFIGAYGFVPAAIQPGVNALKRLGVTSTDQLVAEAAKKGYKFTLDPFLLRQDDPETGVASDLADWPTSIPKLLDNTAILRLTTGRTDLPRGSFDNAAEFTDWRSGSGQTDFSVIARLIKESGWKGTVIIAPKYKSLRKFDPKASMVTHLRHLKGNLAKLLE